MPATLSDSTAPLIPFISAAPLPPKLARQILELEYVNMAELVPDTWRYEEEGSKCCHQSRRTSRRAPVTDILLWLECYASMAALLATRYPNKAAELVAYQRTIFCAHRDFEGEAWATYDTCYRRQAAAKKSLDWSQVDFNLYNQTFAGQARVKRRRFCLSEYHRAADCYYAPDTPPAHSSWSWQEEGPRAPQRSSREFSPGYMYQSHTPRFQSQQVNQSIETCNLFSKPKGNMCRYKDCIFTHLCSEWCYGPHPASKGTTKKPWARKRPHSPPSTRFNPRQS